MAERAIRASFAGVAYQVNITNRLHQWASDVAVQAGGKDIGPSPHELLLSSLGACTSITVEQRSRAVKALGEVWIQ